MFILFLLILFDTFNFFSNQDTMTFNDNKVPSCLNFYVFKPFTQTKVG